MEPSESYKVDQNGIQSRELRIKTLHRSEYRAIYVWERALSKLGLGNAGIAENRDKITGDREILNGIVEVSFDVRKFLGRGRDEEL